jgi:hypothetical protein
MDRALAETGGQKLIASDSRVFDFQVMARLATRGKTVGEVYRELCVSLRHKGLNPEWLCPANSDDDPDEAAFGARLNRPWPVRVGDDRISMSVCAGIYEGWIVHIDSIVRRPMPDLSAGRYTVMPLLRAKVLSCDQAWQLAREIAHQLDTA